MKIFVCVKHVPDTAANVKIVNGNSFDESVKFVVNPYDEYAIEEAVQIKKDKGGEVIIVTLGTTKAVASIRSALAMGADRGIHIKTDELMVDAMTTSKALKKAIEQDGGADLVLTGKQSVDTEGMQTQYYLAQELGLPVVTDAVSLSLENDQAIVECDQGSGELAIMELDLPCVIGANKGLNEPRYPKLPDILKAKRKSVKELALTDLVPQKPDQKINVISLEAIPEKGEATILEGNTTEAVDKLVAIFRENAVI
jgi:electron transfer flavoprotein beta subunit